MANAEQFGRKGFGQFLVDLAELLEKSVVLKLAVIFNFSSSERCRLEDSDQTSLKFVLSLEQKGIIRPDDISRLIETLTENQMRGIAEQVLLSFNKTRQHVRTAEKRKTHSDYPYLKAKEFIKYKDDEKTLRFLNDKSSAECEEMFRRYTLRNSEEPKTSSSDRQIDHLRVVMVGKTGSGKSATANTLMGEKIFGEGNTSTSNTEATSLATCRLEDSRLLSVVDCPGLKDTEHANEDILCEIARMAFLFRDGVHAFIVVWDDTRFTDEAREVLRSLQEMLGSHMKNYCLLVYSFAESRCADDSLDEYVTSQKRHSEMKSFLDEIDWRVVAINNKSDIPAEKARNREVLVAMIDRIVHVNKRKLYINDNFQVVKQLHEKIKNVCHDRHPALVAAVIEVFDVYQWYVLSKDDIFARVVKVLKKSKTGYYVNGQKELKLFNGAEETCLPRSFCEGQVFFIFDALGGEIREFANKLTRVQMITIHVFGEKMKQIWLK